MFGKNEIVGKKYFKDADKQQMFVTSMFFTIQGEGPYAGLPAFFIRLAKCNLNCSFCDTFFDDGDWLTFDQIEERIEESIESFYSDKGLDRPDWTRYSEEIVPAEDISPLHRRQERKWVKKRKIVLVMTGGEPMLQDNIGPFLELQQHRFEHTQIESNGTQATEIPSSTTLVVSPKCLEKNGVAVKYLKPRKEVLERANALKFVMEKNPDSPYSEVPDWAHEWNKENSSKTVFVSPMNIYNDVPQNAKNLRATTNQIDLATRSKVDEVISFWEPGLLDLDANQANHEFVAVYCMAHGFRSQLQMHLYLSLA